MALHVAEQFDFDITLALLRGHFGIGVLLTLFPAPEKLRGQVQARAPVWTLRTDVPAGRALRAEDLQLQLRELTQLEALLPESALLGVQLRADGRSGQMLEPRDIARPVVVRRGDKVEIRAQDDGVQVSVAGIATASGKLGETAVVRNARSGRPVKGTLIAPGVLLAGSQADCVGTQLRVELERNHRHVFVTNLDQLRAIGHRVHIVDEQHLLKIQVRHLLDHLAQAGATVVLATHDLTFAALVADAATMLFDGEAVCTEPAAAFFAGNLFYRPTEDAFSRLWREERS